MSQSETRAPIDAWDYFALMILWWLMMLALWVGDLSALVAAATAFHLGRIIGRLRASR